MPHNRRRQLFRRQVALAKAARRDALLASAEAVREAARGADLAERSRQFAQSYQPARGEGQAMQVHDRLRFAGAMQGISNQAQDAMAKATKQLDLQSQRLAKSEDRLKRLEEKLQAEEKAADRVRLNRQSGFADGLARKLQN